MPAESEPYEHKKTIRRFRCKLLIRSPTDLTHFVPLRRRGAIRTGPTTERWQGNHVISDRAQEEDTACTGQGTITIIPEGLDDELIRPAPAGSSTRGTQTTA